MKLYKANHYFRLHQGLDITDKEGEIVINIKGGSSKEIELIARKILSELNRDYYTKTALLEDNDKNYEMGLITQDERDQKKEDILFQQF